jgi:hypothetical protein
MRRAFRLENKIYRQGEGEPTANCSFSIPVILTDGEVLSNIRKLFMQGRREKVLSTALLEI